jgi:hypothetical protein
LIVRWDSPASLTVERDMPGAIQKVTDALWRFGLKYRVAAL